MHPNVQLFFHPFKERHHDNLRHRPTGLVASGVIALGLFCAVGAATYAGPLAKEVMFVNAKTIKCVTIAGGVSIDNNVPSVQFDCDSDPSRRWMLNEMAGDIYQIKNVQTGKCLTIAGGTSDANNIHAVQFNCDNDQSRRRTIRLKL
jgi:cytolethal distending toxin subunit A